MYYRNANAALVVYDITSLSSFEDMKTWVQGKDISLPKKYMITVNLVFVYIQFYKPQKLMRL